jgi:mono/diheme cytochrome c family protein
MKKRLCLIGLLVLTGCGDPEATADDPAHPLDAAPVITADASPDLRDAAPAAPDSAPTAPDSAATVDAGGIAAMWRSPLGPVPPSPQRPGDPEAGYLALVNNAYVTCGVPARLYDQFTGQARPVEMLPDRNELNARRRFFETAYINEDGIEIVSTNCLSCHMGAINGELMIGLGNEASDFTLDVATYAIAVAALAVGEAEVRAVTEWSTRMQAVGPMVTMDTVGVNPADNLAAVLMAHRDRETLAWSEEPLLEFPEVGVVPVTVPPWWHMKKKNAMFYTTVGRGDHARFMMTASTLCTDTVEEAREIDAYFPDIRAYLASIEPPEYPFEIDEREAGKGRRVFEANCARCHGTYTEPETYPNLVIGVDEVGTDDMLARNSFSAAGPLIEWYNESFFGELATAAPAEGYIAPPLDGIWATAPYFHNGSVPTVAGVLHSANRPTFWRRSFDSRDYDQQAVGWHFERLEHGKDRERDLALRARIYDTTGPGYGNGGHIYGDALDDRERASLLEYLKTL